MPGRVVPVVAGATVVLLALPVFLAADWRIAGWTLGAVLWVAAQALGAVLARLRVGGGALASSGVVAFGMMFRAIAVMIVVFTVAASDARLALSAALVYALAYTLELAVSLLSYFGTEATR